MIFPSKGLGLMLFDIPKDVVFMKILVISNIFGFPVVHWAPRWNKTINFGGLPFKLKFKIEILDFVTISDNLLVWS